VYFGELKEDQAIQIDNRTMAAGVAAYAYLRHLLQAADPIPKFAKVPAGLTLRKFFDDFLVVRGPSATAVRRVDTCFGLFSARDTTEARILQLLRDVKLERTKEITTLSTFSRMTRIYRRSDRHSADVRAEVEKSLFLEIARHYFSSRRIVQTLSAEQYMSQPEQLSAHLTSLVQAFRNDVPMSQQGEYIGEVIYGLLTSGFDFHRYRHMRKDLRDADDQVKAFFAGSAEGLVAAQFPAKKDESERERKKRLWIIGEANRLGDKPELLGVLKAACDA
jgi:hypothetical protein